MNYPSQKFVIPLLWAALAILLFGGMFGGVLVYTVYGDSASDIWTSIVSGVGTVIGLAAVVINTINRHRKPKK